MKEPQSSQGQAAQTGGETGTAAKPLGAGSGAGETNALGQITWLRGVLRIIAEQIREPGPGQPAEECYYFARDLARAALGHQGRGDLQLGDLRMDPEQIEESAVAFQSGDYQTAEEILRELQGGGK